MNKYLPMLLTVMVLCVTATRAQNVNIVRAGTSEPCTPVYQDEDGLDSIQVKGMTQSTPAEKKWFRIWAEYSTDVEWLDRLTVDYYVLVPGTTNVFRGTTAYTDIPRGRGHLSEMYLHFNSYARHYKRGDIHYAIIALIDGKQAALETSNRKPATWWNALPVHPGGLLDRNETPFAVINVERFDAPNPRLRQEKSGRLQKNDS